MLVTEVIKPTAFEQPYKKPEFLVGQSIGGQSLFSPRSPRATKGSKK